MRAVQILFAFVVFCSCKEQVETAVGFEKSTQLVDEADSVYHVSLDLGPDDDRTATVHVEVSGTAGLDADFVLSSTDFSVDMGNGLTRIPAIVAETASSGNAVYTAYPGQRYLTIPIRVIDDDFVEPTREVVRLTVTGVSSSSNSLQLTNTEFDFTINGADAPPAGAIKVDLSWLPVENGSVNQANFDLFLVRNARITGGEMVSYTLVDGISSEHDSGYESITLTTSLPDDRYYILMKYEASSVTADVDLVLSKNQTFSRARGTLSTSDVGRDYFYGPITKSGSNINFRNIGSEDPRWLNLPN